MKKIKLFDPYVGDEERASVERILNSHFWASGSGEGSVKNLKQNSEHLLIQRIVSP